MKSNKWTRRLGFFSAFSATQYSFLAILIPATVPGRDAFLAAPIVLSAVYYFVFRGGVRKTGTMLLVTAPFLIALLMYFSFNSVPYDSEKVSYFFIALGLFGVLTAYCLLDEESEKYLPFALAMLGLTLGPQVLFGGSNYQADRYTLNDANPIWLARALAFAFVGVYYIFLNYPKLRWICCSEIIVLVIAILYTGSRGPFVSMLIAGVVMHLTHYRTSANIRNVVLVSAGSLLLYFTVIDTLLDTLSQFRAFNSYEDSTRVRVECIAYSFDQISKSFEGYGIGSFFFAGLTYPHNIFLEFFYEWGWIFGAFIVSAILVAPLGFVKDPKRNSLFLSLFAVDFFNASVSGDITSPRLLYALVIVGYIKLTLRRASNSSVRP